MKKTDIQLNRESQADREVGHTTIAPSTAWFLTLAFLAVISSVPAIQIASEFPHPRCCSILREIRPAVSALIQTGEPLHRRIMEANRHLLAAMNKYEDALEDDSVTGQMIRPRIQYALSRWLGAGNEQAYCGRNGWLFYRPDVDYVTGHPFLDPRQLAKRAATGSEWQTPPQPDPRLAIISFKNQLFDRGISLIVVPTPVKPVVHPSQFSETCADIEGPIQNQSYHEFRADLKEAGVLVFDPADALTRTAANAGTMQFLATDTHWRPESMRLASQLLADYIRERGLLPSVPTTGDQERDIQWVARGDIARMLQVPYDGRLYPKETVLLRQVLTRDDKFWRPDTSADLLLLGDSFSSIYSLESMGWGESSGFAEQLSAALQRPVDCIIRNDDGAYATRAVLSRELARGRDRLEDKKLVIYQFAVRELAQGDWRLLDLSLGRPVPSDFIVLDPGEQTSVAGTISEISPAPRPGTVPYKDHIVSIHLIDTTSTDGDIRDEQAVVYMQSMVDNKWTDAARYRVGDELRLTLKAWSDVENRFGSVNRSELNDLDLQLQEPCWGELTENIEN
ncbi:MAG: hypothetical protein KJ626_15385 [Verrucomicrobia bacterium]|nr:hypothetical protein [Verrucomicrobiota bacterium]